MKAINSITTGSKTNIPLQKLVDDVVARSCAGAANDKILIKNNISADLYINTNEDIVASVIEGMLGSMIANAGDGDIDISARELFSNTIKLCVRDNNCYNTYAVACSLQTMVPLTEKIGGYLNITNQRQKITTIEFSFPIVKDDEKEREEE